MVHSSFAADAPPAVERLADLACEQQPYSNTREPRAVKWGLLAFAALCLAGCSDRYDGKDTLNADRLVGKLRDIRAGVDVGDAHETPIEGLVGVKVGGGNVIYGTPDGRYIVAGDLFALKSSGLVNLTERLRTADRKLLVTTLDPATMITYQPDDVQAVINVFTDVTCGFCKAFHTYVDELVGHGVEVRYAAFPRAGIDSHVYRTMVSVWCATDPKDALSKAKRGEPVPELECDGSPVDNHYRIGRAAGIGGTPGILLADGRYIPGFNTVGALLAEVGID